MSDHDVLERAARDMGHSTLDLEQVYRLRAHRQIRRRVAAGSTAIVVVVLASTLLAGWLGRTPSIVPGQTSPSSTPPASSAEATPPARSVEVRTATMIEAVAAGSHGYVAVGIDTRNEPAAWSSQDGLGWQLAIVELPGEQRSGSIDGVLRSDGRYLAWGRVGGDACLWMSDDGRSWSTLADETMFGGPGDQVIDWLGGGHYDAFTAGGHERTKNGHRRPIAWQSSNGNDWERFPSISKQGLSFLQSGLKLHDGGSASGPVGIVSISGDITVTVEPRT